MRISDAYFVKNPTYEESITREYGARNGLVVVGGQALAVRVTGNGNYVTRLVVPEYQLELSKMFRSLPHEHRKYPQEGVIAGKIYSFEK